MLAVFSIGSRRLHTISKTVFHGGVPKEKRGGNRKERKFASKKESVIKFIKKLHVVESHHSREKSKRVYLPCHLNMNKLVKMYNGSVDTELKVKYKFFRNIFLNNFNIGFNSPATNACGTCILLKNKLQLEKDPQKRVEIMTQKRVHSLKANAFYELTKEKVDDALAFCFDMQQIHPLPKSPIQDAFYARQMSYYNFCIVGMRAQSPHFFTWTEDEAGKGSVEVGSAFLSYLTKTLIIPPT